jgi:kumamolisin
MTADAQPIGELDPDSQLEVTVLLRPRRPLEEVAAPLSREEYAARYGADPDDMARVESFARAHGLDVVESSQARRSIVLRGSAAKLGQVFGVTLVRYRAADAQEFRAPSDPITIPPELADVVQGVFGLDDRPVARPT